MTERKRQWHSHKKYGYPYIDHITGEAKSGAMLNHSHEGGNVPHKHVIRIQQDQFGRSYAARDDTPIFETNGDERP